jgi:hypothetical protein
MRHARLLLVLLPIFAFGCTNALEKAYTPRELAKLLSDAGGWKMLPFPDSKYAPGSLIKVTEADGIRWIGAFGKCNIPAEFLTPVPGNIPPLDFKREAKFSASLAANLEGIKLGPEFSSVRNITLKIDEYGADAIDLLGLCVWQSKPENTTKIAPVCTQWLRSPDHYFENEAFRISRGKFTLYDQKGTKIKLTPSNVTKYLEIGADASYTVTTTGEVTFTTPHYLAIRKAIATEDHCFDVLGAASRPPKTADPLLDRLISTYPND